jgi:hypothetical protein
MVFNATFNNIPVILCLYSHCDNNWVWYWIKMIFQATINRLPYTSLIDWCEWHEGNFLILSPLVCHCYKYSYFSHQIKSNSYCHNVSIGISLSHNWPKCSWAHSFILQLWCLMPLSTIFQLYCGQVYWLGNQRTQRKPPTVTAINILTFHIKSNQIRFI